MLYPLSYEGGRGPSVAGGVAMSCAPQQARDARVNEVRIGCCW